MKKVYFDSAATTQMREEVITAMTDVMRDTYGNPSSTHAFGRAAKSLIENTRKKIATILNVQASEIVFTSGGTEADNQIIQSCVRDLNVKRIISSPVEHHAVLHTLDEMQHKFGVNIEMVKVMPCGNIDIAHLEELLSNTSQKTLVSLMHVNNEIGTLLDIDRVAKLCKQYSTLFHSDTVQSIGHYHIDLSQIPVDFTAVAAHKFHGPKGIGFAFIRKNTGIKSLIFGGEQERGMRAGTESVHNIVGLGKAFEIAYERLEEEQTYITQLKDYFKEQLLEKIPGVKFNGSCADNSKSTYTLLNVCLPIPSEKSLMLLFQLDLNGIACSKGSACQSGSDKGSHVLQAVLDEEDLKKPSIRFSFSSFNTKEEIDYVVQVLKTFIEQ